MSGSYLNYRLKIRLTEEKSFSQAKKVDCLVLPTLPHHPCFCIAGASLLPSFYELSEPRYFSTRISTRVLSVWNPMENNSNILFKPSGPSPVKFDICLHKLMASGPMHPVSSTPKKCKLARVVSSMSQSFEYSLTFLSIRGPHYNTSDGRLENF
jgi:hypothetical protein